MKRLLLALALLFAVSAHAQRPRPSADIVLRPTWSLVILEFPEPAIYERWWREIADCEHLPLPAEHLNVRYFAVNGREFGISNIDWLIRGVMNWAIGYSIPNKNEMYLAFPYLDEEYLFKHEATHFLMYWAGEDAGHPESRYGTVDNPHCGIVPYRRPGIDDK